MNSISDKSRKGLKFKFEPDKMIINFLFSKKASKAADVLLPAIMISYFLNKFSKEQFQCYKFYYDYLNLIY